MTNLYYSVLNKILDEVIAHVQQRDNNNGRFRFVELFNQKFFFTLIKKFSVEVLSTLDVYKEKKKKKKNIRFGWIESCRDNMGTWTKTSSSRHNQITSDSDPASYICFLWQIVFFTKAYQ